MSLLGCGLAGAGSIFYNGYQPYLNYVPASLGYQGYTGHYGYNGYNGVTYRAPHYVQPAPVAPYNTASQV